MIRNRVLQLVLLGTTLMAAGYDAAGYGAFADDLRGQTVGATAKRGIPGAHNVDHIGLTVPDLDVAVRFFVDVLGADDLFGFSEGPGTENPADLHKIFDVDPRAQLRVRMLRLGPNINVELMEYRSPDQNRKMPSNSDVDVPHIAFFVDDLDSAAAYLTAHGCTMLGGPFASPSGPKAGQAIRYFKTPWGAAMEILNRPEHMPYEARASARLFGPVPIPKR